MKMNQLVVTSTLVMAAALAGCGVNPTTGRVASERAGSVAALSVPGEIIVKFKTAAGRQALLQKMGLKTVKKINKVEALVVKAANTAETLAALKADPNVAYAEPNYVAKAFNLPAATPNLGIKARGEDELLGQLWGMKKIDAATAWAANLGSREVTVAVVDTGIDYNHPDFSGRVKNGYDFANDDSDAMDDNDHGTHCAGSVGAGIGNGGVVGVAPNVSLLAVKVLTGEGSGSYAGVAQGIVFAADQGVQVISMSLGGSSSSAAVDDACKYAMSKGVLVVAAMGNDNSERPSYPAAVPGVMAVGSTTSSDTRSSFSNFGKHISVGAPGSDILSTLPGGKYDTFSGTSMACPHVAGLAGLVKSQFPTLDAAGIRARIEKTGDDLGQAGFDKQFGHGRINAGRAITAAK